MTIYYIDTLSNYIGGFSGAHGKNVSAYIEVANPPSHASQKWDFVNNAWLPLEI